MRWFVSYSFILLAVSSITCFYFYFIAVVGNASRPIEDHQKAVLKDTDAVHSVLDEVFYVWCHDNRNFEFRHFLSIRSAFNFLQPSRVVLYYENEPAKDKAGYHTWLSELKDQYPFFSLQKLKTNWCSNLQKNIDNYLLQFGGMFVREDVVFVRQFGEYYRSLNYVEIDDETNKDANTVKLMKMSRRNYGLAGDISQVYETPIKLIRGQERIEDSQVVGGKIRMMQDKSVNMTTVGAHSDVNEVMIFVAESSLFPKNIWELNSITGKLLRSVAYNSEDIARPAPDFNSLAPNIAHVIWTNKDPMNFLFYLSVISLLEVASVDKLYLHGDGPPSGFYWNLIKNHQKLRLVRRRAVNDNMELIYGNPVQRVAHITDVWRIDILNRYGGLYVDADAIFLKPLDRAIRAYDAVASYDFNKRRSFPESYQNGILLGKRGAEFWRLHLESMKVYIDRDWLWNSCYQMYKIKERHPKSLHIEPRLNTICHRGHCYPFWAAEDKNHINKLTGTDKLEYWVNVTYAVHHTYPDLPEFRSYEALLSNNGSTLFGKVGIYVLKRAGMYDYFQTRAQHNRAS